MNISKKVSETMRLSVVATLSTAALTLSINTYNIGLQQHPAVALPVLEPASPQLSIPTSPPAPAPIQKQRTGYVRVDDLVRRNGHYMPKDPLKRLKLQKYIARSIPTAVWDGDTLLVKAGPDEPMAVGLAIDYITFGDNSQMEYWNY
jgi:hypothetical protein